MIDKLKKQKDLEQLQKFITQEKIKGYVSHLWYSSLRSSYPVQFIQLMKKYRITTKGAKAIEYDDELIRDAKDRVNKLYLRLSKYILELPNEEESKKDFEHLVTRLEDLLSKQNLEN